MALADAAQLLEVLRALLAEQVGLARIVTHQLAGARHLEALRGPAIN